MIDPIIREYFKGLKERDELDVIIPDLLTSMGFEVVRRPTVGPRQYGADVIAVGTDTDGVRKLFLFSIKRGDLTRQEWAGSEQALRQSLDEIKDVVLGNRAPEHRDLPVVICITLGGIVPENMEPLVNGYMNANRRPGLDYQVWSGDTLTRKILDGALREELFSGGLRSLLRKSAAMVEEPDVALGYFSTLVDEVAKGSEDPVASARVLYLALWILYVWGRDGGNLNAPYEASEIVVLRTWEMLWRRIEEDNGRRLDASHAFFQIVELHLRIWEAIYGERVLPRAQHLHALSFAVGSVDAVDINRSMFETTGRVAMGGLWRLWMEPGSGAAPRVTGKPAWPAHQIAEALGAMPATNPTLLSPFADDQGIDMGLAMLLLMSVPTTQQRAGEWAKGATRRIALAFRHHNRYPTIDGSYANLLRHPVARTDENRREATAGSIVMPLLAMVAWALRDDETVREIGEFQKEDMAHSNWQTWVPNSRTEGKIWHGERWQGSALGGLVVGDDGAQMIATLQGEAGANPDYPALSAIRLEHWPVLLLACRRYRLPVPPQLWMGLLDAIRPAVADDEGGEAAAGDAP